jgi:monoamine oxidase
VPAQTRYDVIIIGAGAAGLAALQELDRARCRVLCLEGRDRIGGRVFTARDEFAPVPIELGAEFVHGRSPEIWDLARSGVFTVYDCNENSLHIKGGSIIHEADAWLLSEQVMDEMHQAAASGLDRTFSEFLHRSSQPADAKRLAKSFVEGFNAADSEIIGIASLAKDAAAAAEIDGDNSFRLADGYDALIRHLIGGVDRLAEKLVLNSVVERVEWNSGQANIRTRSNLTGQVERYTCRAVLVTVPLGVLQADPGSAAAIEFSPEPRDVMRAARSLKFGHVIRLILRFREPFWEENSEFANIGFLLSDERFFPTWWTTLPIRSSLITGWSAGPHVKELLDQPRCDIVLAGIADLARITRLATEDLSAKLEAAYFHDWHSDPFARGAYSYVPAGLATAREQMAHPVSNTLFFAGEATETEGHSATVHGAVASGRRAVRQILDRI